jgi:hypothetical protein
MHSSTTASLPSDVYESISDFIISKLKGNEEISFNTLLDDALKNKSIKFEQNLGWCLLQVKHDLEARGVIRIKIKRGYANSQSIKLKRKGRPVS